MKIFIVTELFHPDDTTTAHLLTDIATKLSNEHDVTVICGPAGYDGQITSTPLNKNIKVVRIAVPNSDKNSLFKRLLKFITLTFGLIIRVTKLADHNSHVFMVTNPAPLLLLMPIAKRIKRFRVTLLVHDIFPENVIAAGILKPKSFIYGSLKKLFDRAYSSPNQLITIGHDMEDVLKAKVERFNKPQNFSIIQNWADPFPKTTQRVNINEHKITITFAGNIGRVQGISEFLDTFEMAGTTDVDFRIYGEGAMRRQLCERIETNQLNNVSYGGRFGKSNQFDIYSACDIGLVILTSNMYGLGVPSKSYNIMQAGKPILFIGDSRSEIAQMIKSNDIGFVFENSETTELLKFLQSLSISSKPDLIAMGKRAKILAQTEYSRENQLNKYAQIFNE